MMRPTNDHQDSRTDWSVCGAPS